MCAANMLENSQRLGSERSNRKQPAQAKGIQRYIDFLFFQAIHEFFSPLGFSASCSIVLELQLILRLNYYQGRKPNKLG
jgi:hypothetical protein